MKGDHRSANNVPMNKVGTTGSAGSASSAAISDTGSAGSAHSAKKGGTIHYAPKANFEQSAGNLSGMDQFDLAKIQSASVEFREEWKRIKGSVAATGSGSGAMNGCRQDFEEAKSNLIESYERIVKDMEFELNVINETIRNAEKERQRLLDKYHYSAWKMEAFKDIEKVLQDAKSMKSERENWINAYNNAISSIQSLSFDSL